MATQPRDAPFVGRDAELGELTARLDVAAAGSGGLVLLSGPAGIGKTRTAEELARRATAVVRGRCVDDPGAPPLWPWRQVLRGLPEAGSAAANALSEVDLLREQSADPEAARFRFVTTATEALLAAAEPDGLLVLLEDLHWADETSLRLLRHLAGELHGSRLLVVGTYRHPAGAADGAWQRTLPDLLRWPGTQAMSLPPLTEDDVRRYLGTAAPTPDAVRALHRRSGGNPLYLRALTWGRAPAADGGPPGAELRSLVRATLATLPPATLDLIDSAAVLGEEVDVGLLAAVTGRPSAEVATGLDVAVASGVLSPVPEVPGRRRFLHAVVRDAVYADLSPSTREELHRRSAETLERVLSTDDPAGGVVAGHWLRAASDPEGLRRAALWAQRAADAATRSLAFDEAAAFLATALDASVRAGGSEESRAQLLVDLAVAEFRAGRSAAALDHAAAASELAGSARRGDLLAAAALAVHDISGPGFPERVIALCQRALAEAATAGPAQRSRLLSQLASALTDAGRITAAAVPSAEALQLAEARGDPEAVIDAVRARMKAAPEALDREERMRLGGLAIRHGTSTGQPLAALWGHKWRIDAQFEMGDLGAARDEMAQITTLAQRTRLPLLRWHDVRLRASLAALIGRFPEALDLNDEARTLGETALAEDRSAAGLSTAFLSQHYLVTGDRPEFAPAGVAVLTGANEVPVVVVSRALLALVLGREEEAASRYDELRPHLSDPDFGSSAGVSVNVLPLVEHFSDAEAARLLTDVVARQPAAAFGAGIYGFGSTSGLLGRLAIVRGEWNRAATCFEEALEVDLRTGARPSVVLDRIGLALTLLERCTPGDVPRAFALARQAASEARRLGMPGPACRATALADRAAAATRAADPLTPREREIASLVAQALTNRQIAERLFLSERTVESHVRNILAKLGLANRTEIATSATGARPR